MPKLPPLSSLAEGFRKRTLVTAKVFVRAGARVAGIGGAGDEEAAERLVAELDRLKGLGAKLGQMMSYLDHSLPPNVQAVLARLQSQQRGVAYGRVREVITGDLGAPPEELFDAFEPEPFAAASLGQVHRARLADRDLAVKVQYPDMERLLGSDLAFVERFAGMATFLSAVDGKAVARELTERMLEECDYEREADNQEELRERFAGRDGITIPGVVRTRSARRVLTTELAPGMAFSRFAATAPQAARDRAGALIYSACFDSIFHHGVYNADPHPGNYLFSPSGDVTLLDFGCIKRFTPEFIAGWKRLARSVLDGDLATFRAAWTEAGFVARRGFDFQHQLEAMQFLYTPMRTETFTFTHEFVAAVNERLMFANENKWKLAMPPDWLFVNRLQAGLFSVLALLGTRTRYGDLFRAAIA